MQPLLNAVLPVGVQHLLKGWFRQAICHDQPMIPVQEYKILKGEIPSESNHGWQAPDVAKRQHAAFTPLLQQMRAGNSREDFSALAEAIRLTQMDNPLVVEVGCGSAWNKEVLVKSLPSIYHVTDSWENYEKMKQRINLRYQDWKKLTGN